jgi:fermentation-respiration switch protein FrsA (DUF1100 family)
MKKVNLLIILLFMSTTLMAQQNSSRIIKVSENVNVEKVIYMNRYGIELCGELFTPKDLDRNKRYSALVVGAPYGGVKEQGPSVWANTLAQRGFVVLIFDPSFMGESGGRYRHISSPDFFVEDFMAGVDFLGTRTFVDREKIGAIGICGSGGFSLSAAQVDQRIKAVVTASMVDISMAAYNGMAPMTKAERAQMQKELCEQRYQDFLNGAPAMGANGSPEKREDAKDPLSLQFHDFYYESRGNHPNSTTRFSMTSSLAMMNFQLLDHIKDISPRPIMIVIGDKAETRPMNEHIYSLADDPKEMVVVPNCNHTDLYDQTDKIPFDKIVNFFNQNLK